MRKHYKLTEETKILEDGITKVFRIESLVDGPWGPKGTKGGFVQSEENLSQGSKAWVGGEACVFGDACVSGEALVCGRARVYGKAWVSGNVWVYDDASVFGNAQVSGKALVSGNERVSGAEPQNPSSYSSSSVSGPLTRAIEALEKLSGMEEAISVLAKAKEEKSNTL